MGRVNHFEIQADDVKRAVKFYEDALGWKIDSAGMDFPYFLATTGKDSDIGINGAIMPRSHGENTIVTVGVESLDEAIAKVKAAGGKTVNAKQEIPGIGWFIYCQDTEDNVFGLLQPTDEGM